MIDFTLVVTAVLLIEPTFSVFDVVLEFPTVSRSILVEVLPHSMLDIVLPVSYVQFTLDVVVFPLAMFAAFLKLSFVTLSVFVYHGASAMGLFIHCLPFIDCPICTVQHLTLTAAEPTRLMLEHVHWY